MMKRKVKKMPFIIFLMFIVIIAVIFLFINGKEKQTKDITSEIKKHYSNYVQTKENVKIYDKKENVIGEVSSVILKLKNQKITNKTKYFYAENIDAYISYKDVRKTDKTPDNTKKEYIPFNMEINVEKNAKIYENEKSYYKFNKEIKMNPIKIDQGNYYFLLNESLVYINEKDIKEKKDINKFESADEVAVINYHYVINEEEQKECKQSICLLESQYDEQMKYLKDNNYYTATMEDLELWMDKKINLPKKTVVITIDDGWYLPRNIQILEKYDLHATLFLIGSLASPEDYKSNNLEIHSHTWNMHNLGECKEKRGGAILCKDKDYILSDLKKSRESLNNSVYFAYPFYEYNDHSIEALKEAGFHMAFAGGARKVTRESDKFKVPRFGITNKDTVSSLEKIIS